MPEPTAPDADAERASLAGRARNLLRKHRDTIAAVAAAAAGALLLGLAATRQRAAEDDEPAPPARTLTPAEAEFEAIVYSVAEHTARLKSVTVNGFWVEAEFRSNSGRGSWACDIYFDPETYEWDLYVPYGAMTPRPFARQIRERLVEAAAAKEPSPAG
ncbi:hypothetical protein [Streptomyces sp. NBC_00470]|uniref:hypothetical protein n=1 Tax=Streptomyces sp. NBC_00470 TaxID=2975753 RepID=UPI002F916490